MTEQRTRTNRQTRVGFDPTQWTSVMLAVSEDQPGSRQALEQFCQKYWRSIYAFLRQKGTTPEDAKDLTQGFFVHLLQGHRLRGVHPSKGKLRSFLLTALQNYTFNQRDWARAQKRGGGRVQVPMEAIEPIAPDDPARAFDCQWAVAIFDGVLQQLQEQCAQSGKATLFEAVRAFLTAETERGDYSVTAAELKMTENALRTAVSRLRADFRELLRVEVAKTVDDPAHIEDEVRYLLSVV